MSYLKFQHVFAGLMTLSGFTAFVLPSQSVQKWVPGVAVLFAPVSRPSGAIARWAHGKFAVELSEDARSAEIVKRENLVLKNELVNLYVRLDKIRQQEDYRREIGDIRQLCTPYSVIGTDSGPRSTLLIQGSSLGSLRDGMPVLYPDGIVGQVQQAGIAGARVQLITDAGFHRVRVGFARFNGSKLVRIKNLEGLAEGTGKGLMQIRGLSLEVVNHAGGDEANLASDDQKVGLKAGDLVILSETDWPPYLQGWVLGSISSINPREDAPLFAQIMVKPLRDLLMLREVMVVTKTPKAPGTAK